MISIGATLALDLARLRCRSSPRRPRPFCSVWSRKGRRPRYSHATRPYRPSRPLRRTSAATAGDIKEAGAGGIRLRRRHMASVDRVGQIRPAFRGRQAEFFGLGRIETGGCDPGVHACPEGRLRLVDEFQAQLLAVGGSAGFEHALRLQEEERRQRQATDHVGLQVIAPRQQFQGDQASGARAQLTVMSG